MQENRRGAETHEKKKGNLDRGERNGKRRRKRWRTKGRGRGDTVEDCSVHFLPPPFSFPFNFRPLTHSLSPTVSICFSSLRISLWFPLSRLSCQVSKFFFISVQSLSHCGRQQELELEEDMAGRISGSILFHCC